MMGENPDKYLCPRCGELMIDACQTANCGHRLCKGCLEQLFKEGQRTAAKCPISGCQVPLLGEDGIRYFPDRCLQKEIRERCTIKCTLGQCKWVGAVRKLEDHKTECHPSYIVKPIECCKATHVMVDAKHLDATQSMQHHLEKLTDDMCHTVKVLGEALSTQKHTMDHVMKEDKDPNVVPTQSPMCMGQPSSQEPCVTQKAFNLMIEPEMDTSALTQVDQYLHGQQVEAINCTTDHQACIGVRPLNQPLLNQCCTPSKLQPIMSNQSLIEDSKRMLLHDQATNSRVSPLPSPKLVNQYTQTMPDNHPSDLPQKTKPSRSATLPQQGTIPSLDCSPPRSFSVGSDATVTTVVHQPNEFTCEYSENEMRQKELERKNLTMQNILKEELDLKPAKGSPQNEPRKRIASVPARNLKNVIS